MKLLEDVSGLQEFITKENLAEEYGGTLKVE